MEDFNNYLINELLISNKVNIYLDNENLKKGSDPEGKIEQIKGELEIIHLKTNEVIKNDIIKLGKKGNVFFVKFEELGYNRGRKETPVELNLINKDTKNIINLEVDPKNNIYGKKSFIYSGKNKKGKIIKLIIN